MVHNQVFQRVCLTVFPVSIEHCNKIVKCMWFDEHLLRITRTNLTDIFRPCKACKTLYFSINEFIFSIIWIHKFQKTDSQWQTKTRHEICGQPWQRRSDNPRTNLMTKSEGGDVPRPVRNSKIVKLFSVWEVSRIS